MYPGAYFNVEDPEQMAQYRFKGFDPGLRARLVDGTRFMLLPARPLVLELDAAGGLIGWTASRLRG